MKFLALFAACLPAWAGAVEFQPLFTADLRGGYAATVGGTAAGLGLLDLSFVPAMKFGSRSLLPTLYAGTGAQERSISEGTTFVRTAKAGFKPSLRSELSAGRAYSLRLQALRDWNQETLGEVWGNGFYDYDQYGAGAGLELPASDLGFSLGLGADFAHRNYPNNHSIAAAAALTQNKNYYIKDFYVTSAEIVAGFEFHGLNVAYRPEWRSYTDSYVVLKGGTLDLKVLQQDWLHSLDLSMGFAPAENLALNLGLNLSFNDSNQASFDIAGNEFIPDVQDYSTEALSLSLPWKADKLWQGLTLTPSYSILLRQSQKPVQNASGAYLKEKQNDTEHGLGLDAAKNLPWGLRWVSALNYKVVRSNQELVRGTLNNYEYWQASTGLSYAFAAAAKPPVEEGMDDPEFSDEAAPEKPKAAKP